MLHNVYVIMCNQYRSERVKNSSLRKLTSGAITLGDVSHLEDEVRDDAVDRGVLVVQCLLVE